MDKQKFRNLNFNCNFYNEMWKHRQKVLKLIHDAITKFRIEQLLNTSKKRTILTRRFG